MLRDAIPRPVRAVIGSTLTVGGSGLVSVPFGAIIGLPLLVAGNVLCAQSTLGPIHGELSNARKVAAEVLVTLGAVFLFFGCIMTSVITVEYLVALKRGRSFLITWEFWTTLGIWLAAPAFLALGNVVRKQSPVDAILLRAIYWFLHFPGTVVAVMAYAALGLPLTA